MATKTPRWRQNLRLTASQPALARSRLSTISNRLLGIMLDTKRDTLLDAAIDDSRYCLVALAAIVALIIAYTRSAVYCAAVIWQLAASGLMAAAVYRGATSEFPLLNLIVFVLLISIGADGAFLLFSAMPRTSAQLTEARVRGCLRHTAATMFLTQFSTVVPFIVNSFSAVLAFRCVARDRRRAASGERRAASGERRAASGERRLAITP